MKPLNLPKKQRADLALMARERSQKPYQCRVARQRDQGFLAHIISTFPRERTERAKLRAKQIEREHKRATNTTRKVASFANKKVLVLRVKLKKKLQLLCGNALDPHDKNSVPAN